MWKNEDQDELRRYMPDPNRYPVIRDPKKVAKLIKQWRNRGDRQSYDQLVYGNNRLIVSIALKYRGQGVPLLDLVQEGFIGLMRALESFDPKQGRLTTYATLWIKSFIRRLIPDTSTKRPYRLKNQTYQMVSLTAKITTAFLNKYGYWPDDEKIYALIHSVDGTANETKNVKSMTRENVKICVRLLYERYVSLDAPVSTNGDNDCTLGEIIAADTKMNMDEIVEKQRDLSKIEAELNKLEPRTRAILHSHLLEEKTLKEIGKRFGLSRERVRQIEKMGLEKIKRNLKIKNKNSNGSNGST